mgnify:CR=1 FL=1
MLFGELMAEVLNRVPHFEVVGTYTSGHSFLKALPAVNTGDRMVAFVDMGMPELNGRQLNLILQRDYPNLKVIILTAFYNPRSPIAQVHIAFLLDTVLDVRYVPPIYRIPHCHYRKTLRGPRTAIT